MLNVASCSFPRSFWCLCLREPRRLLQRFPSAAQGLIETNEVLGHRLVALDQRVLRLIERALGIEHVDEAGKPVGVELVGQVEGVLAGTSPHLRANAGGSVPWRMPPASFQRLQRTSIRSFHRPPGLAPGGRLAPGCWPGCARHRRSSTARSARETKTAAPREPVAGAGAFVSGDTSQ